MDKQTAQPPQNDFLKMLMLNQGGAITHEKVVSKELFNKDNIRQKTRLDVLEIQLVNRGFFFSKFFKEHKLSEYGNMLFDYYEGINELRPSLDGLSRTEFVALFHDELEQVKEEKQGIRIK